MPKSIISEGKTTQEAIDNGLKELKVSKDKVDIKVLEEENKKSFFSILTPRVERVEKFLKDWLTQVDESLVYEIKIEDYTIFVDIKGQAAGLLIGYRGESLNAMQTILSTIANRNFNDKIKLILDIENYREKRAKILEELAEKVSKTVLKNGKSITLEPMSAYERKIIHTKLQDNTKVETYSIGEGDNRRVVIAKIKN